MSKKQRTILLNDVNDTRILNHQGSFTWIFHDYKKNTEVKIKLDRWWIKYLAENLWEVIDDEYKALAKLGNAMSQTESTE